MNRKETYEYILKTYGAYIIEWRNRDVPNQQKSWLRITTAIIEQDEFLGDRNPDRLRKTIARCHLQLTGNNEESSYDKSIGDIQKGKLDKGYKEYTGGSNDIAFNKYLQEEGLSPEGIDSYRYVNHNGQQKFNILYKKNKEAEEEKTYLDMRDEIIKDMDNHSPKYDFKPLRQNDNGRLLFIGLADIHINQRSSIIETGGEYNSQIAIQRTMDAVMGLLEEAKGYNITDVIITTGNDVLNTDSNAGTTNAGTKQDTDTSIFESFINARKMFVAIIDAVRSEGYNVQIVHIPANHDLVSGFMLTDSLASWYRNTDVVFHADMQFRKYVRFGANLLCFSHGDTRAKGEKLILLMAEESPDWSATTFRYFYLGHVHHHVSEDYPGCTIESLRSVVKPSAWANNQGYISQEGMSAFVHDKEDGQIAKLHFNF